MKEKITKQAWLTFAITSIYSLMQFFLQVSTDMMAGDLMKSFSIQEGGVGMITSAFFWAYLLVQVPAGLLIDRFRLRKVLIFSAGLLTIGCVLFALSQNLNMAIASRFIMGLGAGFGFVGMLFSIGEWFPKKYFPVIVGAGELVGMAGTSAGQVFAPHFVINHSWRSLMELMAILTAVICILMIFFLRNKGNHSGNKEITFKTLGHTIKDIAKQRIIWACGIFTCGTFSFLTVFVDVWGVPFFEKVYGLNFIQSNHIMAFVLAGIAIGGPFLGWIGGRTQKIKTTMTISGIICLLLTILIILRVSDSVIVINAIMFITGVSCSAYLLPFTLVGQHAPGKEQGSCVAFANTLALFGAVFLQPIIGHTISYLNQSYEISKSYSIAIWILPLFIGLALLSLFWIKEKKVA
ncbi:MAG: MFS transporter [Bacteroidales bacterium]